MTPDAPQPDGWRAAMQTALYGPAGFFTSGAGPAAHFRTSAHASPLFASALADLLCTVDAAIGRPDPFDLVDVGAGRGELLTGVLAALPAEVAARVRPVAVELAPRPAGLPADIAWLEHMPGAVTGLLLAVEWLDNVPLELARGGRYLRADGGTGAPLSEADARWLRAWWPAPDDQVVEVGRPRDEAWRAAASRVRRGLALAIDYGHLRADRPADGTLTGYRGGRQVEPSPDGSTDITAHVAMDALAAAAGGELFSQREALHRLGVRGTRPPLALAGTDPAGYLRALVAAGQAAELTDASGLGGHWWLLCPVETTLPALGFGHDA